MQNAAQYPDIKYYSHIHHPHRRKDNFLRSYLWNANTTAWRSKINSI